MTTSLLFSAELNPFLKAPAAIERSNDKPPRRLSGGKSIKNNKEMQNKPNLCVFWAKNSYYEKKQTQYKPKTNPIPASQQPPKPNTNPIKPNFLTYKIQVALGVIPRATLPTPFTCS